MEVEETTLPVIESSDENNAKKGKFLTLLFPSEAVPAEGKDVKKDKNKPLTKVVIRRLPPKLTKDEFVEEFSPLPPHDYFHFVRGDLSLGSHSFSRAYINFLNQGDIYSFKEKYDDYGIQDEKGKMYHAVVEFSPFQRVPRRNALKKKLSKAGTLESDPKYLEFLKKLEEYKNNAANTSEYFHETESSSLKVKITSTPLLEFLKSKKQKKNDLKNDIRPRKRELEKERKRKEEEKRKAERERRKEEKKNSRYDEKNRTLVRGRSKEEKKDSKCSKEGEGQTVGDVKTHIIIPSDPAILQVVIRQEKSTDKNGKSGGKVLSASNEENVLIKNTDSDSILIKSEKKYPDLRTRVAEEKQRKAFSKRDSDEPKLLKTGSRSRKGVPDEKGDNCNVGNSDSREYSKKNESDLDVTKKHDSKSEHKEAKSKFRYSEQRNREREYRNQKVSDWKKEGLAANSKAKAKSENKENDDGKEAEKSKSGNEGQKLDKGSGELTDNSPVKNRRRSLELEKKLVEEVRKRSRSFHDLSNKKLSDFRLEKKSNKAESGREGCETNQSDDMAKDDKGFEKTEDENKEARSERRIRNKDRPSIEIYRPGMGKFSKQRLEQKKEETNCSNTTAPSNSLTKIRLTNKPISKKPSIEVKAQVKVEKSEESSFKSNSTPTKLANEVRTMTFMRSGSKEN